jgi:15-cis-phytoene synthase
MPDDFDYCESLVRESDKDRFVATLFAPAAYRPALYALYAFNIALGRVRELAREPMPGEIRLQWWLDVLSGVGAGEAAPIATALKATIARYRLPLAVFMELIEARSFDLYDDPMGSLAELEAYAEKTDSALLRLAARVLNDGDDPDLRVPTRHAGIALAITALLAALPMHSARRQFYVPLDLMRRHGARPDDVFARVMTAEFRAVLAELRENARMQLSRIAIADVPNRLMPVLLPAALVGPQLKKFERDADPLAPRILPQWRKQWLLWRAARHPQRIVC